MAGRKANSNVASSHGWTIGRLCGLLALITFLLYANTLQNGYVLDDVTVTTGNSLVTKGISGIPGLLTTPRLKGYEVSNDVESYRPVPLISSAIEYQFFGASPAAGHFFNILFFIGCVVTLFLFLNRLFAGQKSMAFIAALLFALHPIHTEVVANIKSRDELLCFFFAFAALLSFLNYTRTAKLKQLAAGAILLFLSFLSKETVIAFVFVVPLVFFFYANESKKRSGIVTAATMIITVLFLAIRGAVLPTHDHVIAYISNPLVAAASVGDRLASAFLVLGMYGKLMLVPYPLLCDYSYNTIPLVGFNDVFALLSLALYAALLITAVYRLVKRNKDPWAFSILFFLGTLALFSNIPFLVYSQMAERFTFFASAGICMAMGLAISKWAGPGIAAGTLLTNKKAAAVLLPVCLAFTVLTVARNADWKDNYTLFTHDLQQAPNNAYLNYYAGAETLKNEAAIPQQQADRTAINYLNTAIAIYPDFDQAHATLGAVYDRLQLFDSSIVHNLRARAINPANAIAAYNLARAYYIKKNYPGAIAAFKTTIALQPGVMLANLNLALCYYDYRQYDSAIVYFNKTLAIDPTQQLAKQGILQANALKGQ